MIKLFDLRSISYLFKENMHMDLNAVKFSQSHITRKQFYTLSEYLPTQAQPDLLQNSCANPTV